MSSLCICRKQDPISAPSTQTTNNGDGQATIQAQPQPTQQQAVPVQQSILSVQGAIQAVRSIVRPQPATTLSDAYAMAPSAPVQPVLVQPPADLSVEEDEPSADPIYNFATMQTTIRRNFEAYGIYEPNERF